MFDFNLQENRQYLPIRSFSMISFSMAREQVIQMQIGRTQLFPRIPLVELNPNATALLILFYEACSA